MDFLIATCPKCKSRLDWDHYIKKWLCKHCELEFESYDYRRNRRSNSAKVRLV